MDEKEKHLVELVLQGHVEAFEPLVTPYRKSLLNLACRMTQDFEDAKEISQEALMRAFRYLKTFDMEKSFRNWLSQILMNVSRNFSKKKQPSGGIFSITSDAERQASHQFNPEKELSGEELNAQIRECLDVLTPREREIFLLRDIEERSIRETAEILGASSISIRVHLSSARKKIKERVKEKFPHLMEGL